MTLPSYLATSPQGVAIAKLRRMIALSAAFQTRCGCDEVAALERVFIRSAPASTERPFAIIGTSRTSWRTLSSGMQNHLRPHGQVAVCVYCDPHPSIPAENKNDRRHEAEDFMNAVIADVADLAAKDDPQSEDGNSHLGIYDIDPDGDIEEIPEPTQPTTGIIFSGDYIVAWGYQ